MPLANWRYFAVFYTNTKGQLDIFIYKICPLIFVSFFFRRLTSLLAYCSNFSYIGYIYRPHLHYLYKWRQTPEGLLPSALFYIMTFSTKLTMNIYAEIDINNWIRSDHREEWLDNQKCIHVPLKTRHERLRYTLESVRIFLAYKASKRWPNSVKNLFINRKFVHIFGIIIFFI